VASRAQPRRRAGAPAIRRFGGAFDQRMTMAARPTLVADIVMLLVRMKPTTPNAP
jgi:hypothetical protein